MTAARLHVVPEPAEKENTMTTATADPTVVPDEVRARIIAGEHVTMPLPADPHDRQTLRTRIVRIAVTNGYLRNCTVAAKDGEMVFFVRDPGKPKTPVVNSRKRSPRAAKVETPEPVVLDVDPKTLRSHKDETLGWVVRTVDGLVVSTHPDQKSAQAEVKTLRANIKAAK